MIIGAPVEKRFGTKWYMGRITGTDTDIETDDNIWRVRYDDGDNEDYNEKELQAILCDDPFMMQILGGDTTQHQSE